MDENTADESVIVNVVLSIMVKMGKRYETQKTI